MSRGTEVMEILRSGNVLQCGLKDLASALILCPCLRTGCPYFRVWRCGGMEVMKSIRTKSRERVQAERELGEWF